MKPEFDDWRWARLEEVPQLALAFKRPVYEAVAEQFAEYARPLAEAGAA
jgi:putative (di)nucleoside polyphosphate hydrolase